VSVARVKNLRPVSKFLDDLSHYLAIAVAFFIPISTTLTDISFIGAVILSLFTGNWQGKWSAIKASRIAFYFLAFFALCVIGISYTSAPFKDVSEILLKYGRFVFAVLLIPLFVEEKWRKWAIYAFLAAMVLTLFLSYVKYFGWFGVKPQKLDVSIFKDHIQQNFLMAFSCYFLALYIIKHRNYWWIIGPLLVLAVHNTLFLSQGRSGYVVLIALMLLFVWQMFRWKGLILGTIAAVTLLGAAFLFSNAFSARMQAIGSEFQEYVQGYRNTSIGMRMSYDLTSIEMIKKHPIIGTGTGSFETEYNKLFVQNVKRTTNPHNEYFNVMVQLGSVGLIFLLIIFYMTWRFSKDLPLQYKYVAQALTVVMIIGSCINSWLMDTTEGHFYVYFMALCFGAMLKQKETLLEKEGRHTECVGEI
jgi:O-antigen ligase